MLYNLIKHIYNMHASTTTSQYMNSLGIVVVAAVVVIIIIMKVVYIFFWIVLGWFLVRISELGELIQKVDFRDVKVREIPEMKNFTHDC